MESAIKSENAELSERSAVLRAHPQRETNNKQSKMQNIFFKIGHPVIIVMFSPS